MAETRLNSAAISERSEASLTAFAAIEKRQLEDDERACLMAVRACYGACIAVMSYGWYVDVMSDELYSAVRDCCDCCDVFCDLMGRESELFATAAELCMAGADACAAACSLSADPIVLACAAACRSASTACSAMADAGEATEGRSGSRLGFEVRGFRPEVRAASDGKASKIVGYPIVFGDFSEPMVDKSRGLFRERIMPGSVQFDGDLRADFNHDSNCILGRVAAGTLRVSVDNRGVSMEADPPDTGWARDLMTSIDRGDINQGSFAFRVLPDGEEWTREADQTVRSLKSILVRRVSVVSDPAYTGTRLQVRSNDIPAKPEPQTEDPQAGRAAPPATSGAGKSTDLLRRELDLMALET